MPVFQHFHLYLIVCVDTLFRLQNCLVDSSSLNWGDLFCIFSIGHLTFVALFSFPILSIRVAEEAFT